MNHLLRVLCYSLCFLLWTQGTGTAADTPGAEDSASQEAALLRQLCRVMQKELAPYLPEEGVQRVVAKKVPAKAFEKIDEVFPLPEKWVYIERGEQDLFTVYLNEDTGSARAQDGQQAQRRAEALTYAFGRALQAPAVSSYWKKQEGQPVPPVYDAKRQVNPTFVLACHLAAVCRSRISKTPCTLHDYVRELAERDPRLQPAAEEVCAHYPADAQALREMLEYEAFWIRSLEEMNAYLNEEEDLEYLVPVSTSPESGKELPVAQREYVQQKYPVAGLEPTEYDIPGSGDMVARVHRQATQRRTIALTYKLLEWQDKQQFWGPKDLKPGSKEYKERERFLRELSDLLCHELIKAVRRLSYVSAAMKDKESALKYEEAFLSCWADVDALSAPIFDIGREYYRDLGWGLTSRSGYLVLREVRILEICMNRFKMHRLDWYGAEHTRVFCEKLDKMRNPGKLFLAAGIEKREFQKAMYQIHNSQNSRK